MQTEDSHSDSSSRVRNGYGNSNGTTSPTKSGLGKDWRMDLQKANVITKLDNILRNGRFADVTFIVGDPKEEIQCHSLILKMQSKCFEDMLTPDKTEYEVAGFSASVFRKMLKYLYTDKLEISPVEAMETLMLARHFHLNDLQEKCGRVVVEGMTVDNAALLLKKADSMGDKHLGLKAQEYIIKHAEEVFKTPGFKEISVTSLQKLVQTKRNLWKMDETRILEAVKDWASVECVRQGKENTGPNQYLVAKPAFDHIMYRKFNVYQFTSLVVKPKLLPMELMLNIQSDLINVMESTRQTAAASEKSQSHSQSSMSPRSIPDNGQSSDNDGDDTRSDRSELERESDSQSFGSMPSVTGSGLDEESTNSGVTNGENISTGQGDFLTLSRYTGSISKEWDRGDFDGEDYKISFLTKKPIQLKGVALYAYTGSSGTVANVKVKVASYFEAETYSNLSTESEVPEGGGEFDVWFDTPVQISTDEWYTIIVNVDAPIKPYGIGGKKQYSVPSEGNKMVEFNFKNSEGVSGATHIRGQLPKLYFSLH